MKSSIFCEAFDKFTGKSKEKKLGTSEPTFYTCVITVHVDLVTLLEEAGAEGGVLTPGPGPLQEGGRWLQRGINYC